jgi:hypothetical protein
MSGQIIIRDFGSTRGRFIQRENNLMAGVHTLSQLKGEHSSTMSKTSSLSSTTSMVTRFHPKTPARQWHNLSPEAQRSSNQIENKICRNPFSNLGKSSN